MALEQREQKWNQAEKWFLGQTNDEKGKDEKIVHLIRRQRRRRSTPLGQLFFHWLQPDKETEADKKDDVTITLEFSQRFKEKQEIRLKEFSRQKIG